MADSNIRSSANESMKIQLRLDRKYSNKEIHTHTYTNCFEAFNQNIITENKQETVENYSLRK